MPGIKEKTMNVGELTLGNRALRASSSAALALMLCLVCGCNQAPALDLRAEKGRTVFFVLGSLDEYLGRNIREGDDLVEHFYCDENAKADVFAALLRQVASEQGLRADVRVESFQGCLREVRCRLLADAFNRLYRFQFTSRSMQPDRQGKYRRSARAYVSAEVFAGRGQEAKLAYLVGAYWRYGADGVFRFANARHKAELVAGLLREFGASGVSLSSKEGTIPRVWVLSFEPSRALAGALREGAAFVPPRVNLLRP
jgi:hypothetical protein